MKKPTKTTSVSSALKDLPELPELQVIEQDGVDWLATPEEPRYSLSMDHEGENLQDVALTREEFIGLKQHLATIRGGRN